MNNPFVKERAEGFARRLIDGSTDVGRRVDLGFRLAWSRLPTPAERTKAAKYIDEYTRQLARDGVPTERREVEAWTSFARIVLCANEFIYTD